MIVLVAEDDAHALSGYVEFLSTAGFVAYGRGDGQQALSTALQVLPDVVVTDIAMPQLDGYAFARQLRVERPGQKIIALTAFPAGPAGIQDNVFDAYIMKPVEPRVLADSIHRVLGRQKN
jgi:two-component system, response regulator YesN